MTEMIYCSVILMQIQRYEREITTQGQPDLFMQEAVLLHTKRSEEGRNRLLASFVIKGWRMPPR